MEIVVWIISGIAALLFLMAGITKATSPIEKLLKSGLNWAERFQLSTVKFIGIMELSGAIGLILPWALHVVPVLTPIAAGGLALIMVFAMLHHLKYKEYKAIAFNLVLFGMVVFIAIMRFNAL